MPRSSKYAPTGQSKPARNEILDELRAALDEADLRVILNVFKADVAAQLNDLRDFAAAGKTEAARRIAHRLAGLLAQFGALHAAEFCHRMAASTSNPGNAQELAALECASRQAVGEICGDASQAPTPLASLPPTSKPAAKRAAPRRRTEAAHPA
jgi:HPt (histidine-containing phosphotransfer) domain-containing protein